MTIVRKTIDEKSRNDVYTISADETVMRKMEKMSKSNVGALLVIEVGFVSIRRLAEALIEQEKVNVNKLERYILGTGYGQ
jgi:CBS domain-containing protein